MGCVYAKKLLDEYPQPGLFQSFEEGEMSKTDNCSESTDTDLEVPIETPASKGFSKKLIKLLLDKCDLPLEVMVPLESLLLKKE